MLPDKTKLLMFQNKYFQIPQKLFAKGVANIPRIYYYCRVLTEKLLFLMNEKLWKYQNSLYDK